MILKVVGSNSAGNSYILETDTEALLIEAGVRFPFIKHALNYNLDKVSGAIITHSHQDHCKAAIDLLRAGIKVYVTAGEIAAMQLPLHHRLNTIKAGTQFQVGSFLILPFEIKHDTPEPVGFLINHKECGTTLFLTDSYYSPFVFKGLNNVIVECNYCADIINKNGTPDYLKNRIAQSHMNLDTCKGFLGANDLTKVNNIVLIHLSNDNSDAKRMKKEVMELTGKNVTIAEAGLTMEFDKQPI